MFAARFSTSPDNHQQIKKSYSRKQFYVLYKNISNYCRYPRANTRFMVLSIYLQ